MIVQTAGIDLQNGLSVVVAVYNSAATLATLVDRIDAVFADRVEPLEVILVNDGSADESWAAIEALARRYDWVRGIDLARNFGQHGAVLCGIRHARYHVTVTIDDDLQHPPDEILRLVAAVRPGVDLVYGLPVRQHHRPWRIACSWGLGGLLVLFGGDSSRRYSAFRAFRTRLRDAFAHQSGAQVCVDVLLSWGTTRCAAVDVVHRPSARGRSRYGLRKLTAGAIDAMLGFGIGPALGVIGLGLASLTVGLGGLAFGLFSSASPFGLALDPTTALALLVGIQLCALGWLGTYLSRIFETVTGRPPYVIRRTTDQVARERDSQS